jgi:septum formation protein
VAASNPLPLILASASPRRAALLKQAGVEPVQIVAPKVDETPEKGELPRLHALRLAIAKAEAVAMTLYPPLEGRSNREAVREGELNANVPSPKSSPRESSSKISTLPQGEGGMGAVILAADTVVALGRRILPKAESPDEVERCLQLLSGRRHQVITAVAVVTLPPSMAGRDRAITGEGDRISSPVYRGSGARSATKGTTGEAAASLQTKMRTRVVITRVAFKRLTPQEIADYTASGEGEGKAGGYAIQGRAEAFVRFINGSYSNVVGLPLYETLGLLGRQLPSP